MLSKRFLLATGCAAALILLLLVGIDLYAGSETVRQRLETALTRQSGMAVKLEALHFNLWSGLAAQGVLVTPPQEAAASSLGMPWIEARVAWFPLLSGRLVLKRLVLSDPTLRWAQNGAGDWVLPTNDHPEAIPDTGKEIKPRPAKKSSRLEFMIRSARIENATLRFEDPAGENVALLEGVNVDCPRGVQGDFEGTLSIRKATLGNGMIFEDFATPFAFKGGALSCPALQLRLAGGTIRGQGSVASFKKDALFTLDLVLDGVEIRTLQAQVTGEPLAASKTAGTVHGSLDVYGFIGRKKSVSGAGQLRIFNGRMAQFPFFQMIGKALSIEELTNLELQQAQLDLRAGDGKIFVDSLVMESPNLSLTGTGTSNFSGKLNLDARLAATAKITRQLPDSVEANFQPVPGSERKAISFHITGTVGRPQTDLVRVLVGQKIENDLMNVFRTLTGKPKKKSGSSAESPADAVANPTP